MARKRERHRLQRTGKDFVTAGAGQQCVDPGSGGDRVRGSGHRPGNESVGEPSRQQRGGRERHGERRRHFRGAMPKDSASASTNFLRTCTALFGDEGGEHPRGIEPTAEEHPDAPATGDLAAYGPTKSVPNPRGGLLPRKRKLGQWGERARHVPAVSPDGDRRPRRNTNNFKEWRLLGLVGQEQRRLGDPPLVDRPRAEELLNDVKCVDATIPRAVSAR
ncbi:hypothetical protein OUZ56_033145 [Daphnia magna]|uniref:Uncharacterized protein n=1 Tax=Daphnia magna TaxID=35525 RepID=A0ABR0BAB0_9CRUS|nr:hypothetical protein OUZ56_033145 [Daphnia magna]